MDFLESNLIIVKLTPEGSNFSIETLIYNQWVAIFEGVFINYMRG
jgi:hypothetical protein